MALAVAVHAATLAVAAVMVLVLGILNDYGCALMLKSMQQFTYAGCPDGFCFGLSQFADGTHINDSIWRECVHQ